MSDDTKPFTIREALIALDFHANKAMKRNDMGCHDDLLSVADVIRSLRDQCAVMEAAGAELSRSVRASLESLGKPPL